MTRDLKWTLLLVEDDDDDAFLLERAFASAGVPVKIERCRDGECAVRYLAGDGIYADREVYPTPHIVLLDLKIPVYDGLQVLSWIRSQEEYKSTVVVILTSSAETRDVREAYRLNVNAYLVKPSSLSAMSELAHSVQLCWLDHFDSLFEMRSLVAMEV